MAEFSALIELTPGVVPAASNMGDGGQFNVNGQRANANYWMVDGVSANIGLAASGSAGNGFSVCSGSLFNVMVRTNSLVSVDACRNSAFKHHLIAPELGELRAADFDRDSLGNQSIPRKSI